MSIYDTFLVKSGIIDIFRTPILMNWDPNSDFRGTGGLGTPCTPSTESLVAINTWRGFQKGVYGDREMTSKRGHF